MMTLKAVVKFGCGDIDYGWVLECNDDEVCVQMKYGPIWVLRCNVMLYV